MGAIGAAIWITGVGGVLWCIWLGIKNQPFEMQPQIDHRQILMRVVCDEYLVTETQIKSSEKVKHIAEARRAYCYLAHKLLGESLTTIGNTLRKDYSTVLYAVTRMRGFIEMNDHSVKHLKSIENKFINLKIN
jgi:chromosomal replication initiation ATPase DnaA